LTAKIEPVIRLISEIVQDTR